MLIFRRYNKKSRPSQQLNNISHERLISSELTENIKEIQMMFSDTPDLIVRHLIIKQTQSEAALIYLSRITDSNTIYNHVLNPLIFEGGKEGSDVDVSVSLGHIKEVNT